MTDGHDSLLLCEPCELRPCAGANTNPVCRKTARQPAARALTVRGMHSTARRAAPARQLGAWSTADGPATRAPLTGAHGAALPARRRRGLALARRRGGVDARRPRPPDAARGLQLRRDRFRPAARGRPVVDPRHRAHLRAAADLRPAGAAGGAGAADGGRAARGVGRLPALRGHAAARHLLCRRPGLRRPAARAGGGRLRLHAQALLRPGHPHRAPLHLREREDPGPVGAAPARARRQDAVSLRHRSRRACARWTATASRSCWPIRHRASCTCSPSWIWARWRARWCRPMPTTPWRTRWAPAPSCWRHGAAPRASCSCATRAFASSASPPWAPATSRTCRPRPRNSPAPARRCSTAWRSTSSRNRSRAGWPSCAASTTC